jgi:hypothetical protein
MLPIRGDLSLPRGRIAVTARITCALSPSGDSGGLASPVSASPYPPLRLAQGRLLQGREDGALKVLVTYNKLKAWATTPGAAQFENCGGASRGDPSARWRKRGPRDDGGLERERRRFRLWVYGYVVMPEHVCFMLSERQRDTSW